MHSSPARLSRRTLLDRGGRAAAAALLAPYAWSARAAAADSWPTAALPTSAASNLVDAQFLPASELARLGAAADAVGLRATGSARHEAYIQELAGLYERAGLRNIVLDPVPLDRWEARVWSVRVDGRELPNTFYAPFTQSTGPAGISAPMVLLPSIEAQVAGFQNGDDPGNVLRFGPSLRGKIVVFEVPYIAPPLSAFRLLSYPGGWYWGDDSRSQRATYRRPWLNSIGRLMDGFAAAGAAGVIGIWPDLDGAWARQYTPYDAVKRPMPGLWVGAGSREFLMRRARAGATAHLVLDAVTEATTTHNIIGVIPGASDELTVLHSHTDGTNGMEENAPIGLLATTQYLARLPQRALPRTVMVMLSAGHFAGGVGIRRFLDDHADDVVQRITSTLTLEHLGCLEWLPQRGGAIVPSGHPELRASFCPDRPGMVTALTAALRQTAIAGTVGRPFMPAPADAPVKIGWPGEGTYFWMYGKVLNGNTITGPYGLITADLPTDGMVDYDLMRREAITATSTALRLAATPRRRL